MRWVCTKEEAEYMRYMQRLNRARRSEAEEWMAAKLASTKHKWNRQTIWGYRLFDFWCHALGIAVEVDGPEHVRAYDEARDKYNWCRSALLVLRVPNFDEVAAANALRIIDGSQSWADRKAWVKPGKDLLKANGMKPARSGAKKLVRH